MTDVPLQKPIIREFVDTLKETGLFSPEQMTAIRQPFVHALNRCDQEHKALLQCAEILARLEYDGGGRTFPSSADCARARDAIQKAKAKK